MRETRVVTLQQFVDAFSEYGDGVDEETWVFKDLSLDADELDWVFMELASKYGWSLNWECDLSGYIPAFTYWAKPKHPYADLKIRELFAFSRPTVAHHG